MEIRSAKVADLEGLAEIDATAESAEYLHVEHGGEGLAEGPVGLRVEVRRLREKAVAPCPADDDLRFAFKNVAAGIEEGVALYAEHDDRPAATLLATPDPLHGTLDLVDLRVDYDFRRQGIALAMLYRLVSEAKAMVGLGVRAIRAETRSNNVAAARLLEKAGFDLCGIDTRRHTNHDLVKEQATLVWYLSVE